jgi:uncharacterized protein (DUF1697 family)
MPVVISLLRGVNLAGHRKVKMDDLRALYESLGFEAVTTYINSGNVLFKTGARDLARLARRIEEAIDTACGFHSDVILRTPADLRDVIAANPFAGRPGMNGSRLAIHFLPADPAAAACDQARAIPRRTRGITYQRSRALHLLSPTEWPARRSRWRSWRRP